MKKAYCDYRDCADIDASEGYWISEDRLVRAAGTEILARPLSQRGPEEEKEGKRTGLHFIYEDAVPELPFYSVPYLCIFATDGGNGFFSSRRRPYFEGEEEPVYYIPGRKKVFRVADSLEEIFSGKKGDWISRMRPARKIRLFPDREAAERNVPFVDMKAFLPYLAEEPDPELTAEELFMIFDGPGYSGRKVKEKKIKIRKDGDLKTILIRSLKKAEYGLLDDFLYEAVFIPEGVKAPDRSIIKRPELSVYTEGFGERAGDYCLAAEAGGRIVGAVWTRIMDDYGHVDDDTPSFAISLYKEYRGYGIGTELMKEMLTLLKDAGYEKASLSVQKANYAADMYRKLGFEVLSENEEEYIMVCRL